MNRMRIAAGVAVFLLAMGSSAQAEKVYHLHDPGGNVAAHIYQYTQINQQYDRVVIDGQCKSACTTVLGVVPLNKICIAPRGYFMFHAAHHSDRSFSFGQTQLMMQAYAPEVRDWVIGHHALEHVDPYTYLYPKDVTFIQHCSR
jgi:ATP-dependent protease ClpP protease subunit